MRIILKFKANKKLLLTRAPSFKNLKLACVKHTASVHPEPGSNSLKV